VLEELRVDLATYGSAAELVREGFPFARYVQYAIVFDRILRFPITGNRVRNYDGVDELYRHGIDSSKVAYWIAAHDLISEFVPANVASEWRRDARVVSDESDPRAWIDRVLDDEFPLSAFYLSFRQKLEPAPADAAKL